MPPRSVNVSDVTRRLIERAAAESGAPDGAAVAVHRACEQAYRGLTKWVGPTGSHTLLGRALAEAQRENPLLKNVRLSESADGLEGVAELVQEKGSPAAAKALGGVLETLLELLGRLIGAEMAARLVEHDTSIQGEKEGEQ